MTLLSVAIFALVLLGHMALFVYVVNRMHALALARPLVKVLDGIWSAFGVLVPLSMGILVLRALFSQTPLLPTGSMGTVWLVYIAICIFCAISAIFHRFRFVAGEKPSRFVLSNHTKIVDLKAKLQRQPAGDQWTAALGRLPGNEIYELSIHNKNLWLPTLPSQLEGMSITHLSDLHMTGQLDQGFYDEVVWQANELQSDLVVITGDIVEKVHCLDWIAPTLGKLRAPLGVYYVVGNHELRVRNINLVRGALDDAGLIGVGDRWITFEFNDYPIVLAGNELPWFKPAADMSDCPSEINGHRPFRILMSHSPDQLEWAKRRKFDLQMAGHTHGGQVRFPIIGPVLAPSRKGIRHAAGTFYEEPTLLHVSRGIAGTRPLRLNCRPELAQLILTANSPRSGKTSGKAQQTCVA